MKVAVCLSGQARFAKENYQHTYDNLIGPLGADVFCHFWKTENKEHGIDPIEAIRLYKVKTALLEEQIDFYPDIQWPQFTDLELWRLRRMTSMYYSMAQSVARASFSDNIIIKARTDLIFKRPITLEDIRQGLNSLCFYDNRVVENGTLRLYGDEIFWGPFDRMYSLCKNLTLNEPDCSDMTHPAKVMHRVMDRLRFGSKHVDIGQPNIMRNEILHSKRLESLHNNQIPVNDD